MDYTKKGKGISYVADLAVAVYATDATATVFNPGRIYVGQGGTVVLAVADTTDSTTVTFPNVPTGTVIPVLAQRVNATGTTATGFVALS